MEFPVKSADSVKQRTACAVVPLFKGGRMARVTQALDKASRGEIKRLTRTGELSATLGEVRLLHHVRGGAADRVLVVGCGKRAQFGRKELARATQAAVTFLKLRGIRDAITYLCAEPPQGTDTYYSARLTVEAAQLAVYQFDELKSEPGPTVKLRRLGIAIADGDQTAEARRGIADGNAISEGMRLACDLGNRPANVCTPSHLAEVARTIGKESKHLTVKVLNETSMRRLGMGSLLSVTQGASEPAQLIVMEYKGAPSSEAPVALCGKGVTFDTGGISLKPPPKMDEMKYDMCGAASVIATMAVLAELAPTINVVAVVPACENMPGGSATRPGDIVTSLSGQTIEVLNTDAEGRLILCDAMTYAQTYDPRCLIDVATLTGACVIALGHLYTGVFANDESLSAAIVAAGKRSLDSAWPMPADIEYGESLRSNFADFANVGSREGGASVAASFLSKFIEGGLPWAHLDIAGVAWRSNNNKGATGRPVALLVDFLLNSTTS